MYGRTKPQKLFYNMWSNIYEQEISVLIEKE